MRGRIEYGLWDGLEPTLAANVYLRSLDDVEPGQVRARAYQLLPLFRYLAGIRHYEGDSPAPEPDRHISFWDLGRTDLEGYREDLKRRVNATAVREWRRARMGNEDDPAPADWKLSHRTADSYLMAAHEVSLYWQIPWVLQLPRNAAGIHPHAPIRAGERRAGARPKPFRLLTPRKYRSRLRRGLPLEIYNEVWRYLEGRMPAYPQILDTVPHGRLEQARYERAARKYDLAMMRYLRDKAIWAFLMATGFRRGEVLRVRAKEDFYRDLSTGGEYVRLVDRPEDAARVGTELKTGEGSVYIGHTEHYLTHIRAWRDLQGLELAKERRAHTGVPDHPMLFCNDDGGPLTVDGLRAVFNRIDAALKIRARGYAFSPHVCRHTLMTIFRSGGVDASFRQWHLRHKHQATTEAYGSVFQEELEKSIRNYESGRLKEAWS